MSAQEHAAALKIQESWSKYQDTKETCAVCMDIIGKDCCTTECGHKFCAPCFINMAKTAKRACRKMTCAMCRADMKKLVAFDTTENKERLVEFCKVITA